MTLVGYITIPKNFWERSFSSPPSHTDIVNDTSMTLVYTSPKEIEEDNA
tara:strand:- start:23897 stop:24043 length:147 start_codon:yes stop_codon:yes gene_type:complete